MTDFFTKGEWDMSESKLKAAFGKQYKQHTNIRGLKAHITKLFQDRVNFPYLPKQDPPVDPYTYVEVTNFSKIPKKVAKIIEWP